MFEGPGASSNAGDKGFLCVIGPQDFELGKTSPGPAYLVITELVGMRMLMVSEADWLGNQTVENMSFVNMGGKYKLVLATQYLFLFLSTTTRFHEFSRTKTHQAQRLESSDEPAVRSC